ncbi:MAG: cytidylate kinase-like family protein [Bacillota bacterium]|nr:cytidylate kinase-like family protein [Bacillota bacterium]
MKDNIIITISREFGSGGRDIGKKVSEALGIPFYDKAIVDLAAKESGLDAEFIEKGEQKITSSMLFSIATTNYGIGDYYTESSNFLVDKIFISESKAIKEFAGNGSCVIVGRCADYILKNDFQCFNAFIYADFDFRVRRVIEAYNLSVKDAEKQVKMRDKQRAKHYEHYTGIEWGNVNNYHLSIDSMKFGLDSAADVIRRAAELL